MKNLSMLVWLTQLGLSVVVPMAAFTLLAVWLRKLFDLGSWVLIVGIVVGLCCAVDGFRTSLKIMERLGRPDTEKDDRLSFNDHD